MGDSSATSISRASILSLYGEKERLVQEHERKAITTVSTTTSWRLTKESKVPYPQKVKGKTTGYSLIF